MYISTSIVLIAIGAILRYAVADQFSGVSLAMIGLILMVVGAIGLVVSLFQMAITRDRRGTIIEY